MYCIDLNSEEPIMLINQHIGMDADEGMGINGAEFQRELLMLDSMGKKRIQIWINSPGGVVLDGYNIFNAIIKSKTPVDTYNVGIASSIAGVIFMAGRKRIMADYSSLMIHPPHGGDDRKQMEAITESLVTMLSAKSNMSDVEVKYLMDRTTWINSAECFAKGFCTDIEITSDSNKKRMPQTTNVMEMWKVANSINNQKKINNTVMTKVTNKLGLNDAATEENIVSAISKMQNKIEEAEDKAKEMENAFNKSKNDFDADMDNMKKDMNSKKEAFDKLQSEYNNMCEDKVESEKEAAKDKAKNMIEGYAKTGRIKNDEATIAKWTNIALVDFANAEELLKELPLNKVANSITEVVGTATATETNAMSLAVKNKLKREGKI